MKKIFLAIIILFAAGAMVYAQQAASTLPTSAQTIQSAQQFINAGNTKSSQFDSFLEDFITRNTSNINASNFKRLSYEANQLEEKINSEGAIIISLLDKGEQASTSRLHRYEQLVRQYKWKIAEIESTFITASE